MIDSDVEKNVKLSSHEVQYRTVMGFATVVVNRSLDQMGLINCYNAGSWQGKEYWDKKVSLLIMSLGYDNSRDSLV